MHTDEWTSQLSYVAKFVFLNSIKLKVQESETFSGHSWIKNKSVNVG